MVYGLANVVNLMSYVLTFFFYERIWSNLKKKFNTTLKINLFREGGVAVILVL